MGLHILIGHCTSKIDGLGILGILFVNYSVLQDLIDLCDPVLDLTLLVSGCIILSVL